MTAVPHLQPDGATSLEGSTLVRFRLFRDFFFFDAGICLRKYIHHHFNFIENLLRITAEEPITPLLLYTQIFKSINTN